MLSGVHTGSGLLTIKTLQSIAAAGGRKQWPRSKARALRLAGEGVRQMLQGKLVFPRRDGPKNIVEADHYIAAQWHYENARGVVLPPKARTGDEMTDKREVGSHYAPIGLVFSRDVAVQRLREQAGHNDQPWVQARQDGDDPNAPAGGQGPDPERATVGESKRGQSRWPRAEPGREAGTHFGNQERLKKLVPQSKRLYNYGQESRFGEGFGHHSTKLEGRYTCRSFIMALNAAGDRPGGARVGQGTGARERRDGEMTRRPGDQVRRRAGPSDAWTSRQSAPPPPAPPMGAPPAPPTSVPKRDGRPHRPRRQGVDGPSATHAAVADPTPRGSSRRRGPGRAQADTGQRPTDLAGLCAAQGARRIHADPVRSPQPSLRAHRPAD